MSKNIYKNNPEIHEKFDDHVEAMRSSWSDYEFMRYIMDSSKGKKLRNIANGKKPVKTKKTRKKH